MAMGAPLSKMRSMRVSVDLPEPSATVKTKLFSPSLNSAPACAVFRENSQLFFEESRVATAGVDASPDSLSVKTHTTEETPMSSVVFPLIVMVPWT